jgi:hypothetical protein
MLSSGAEKKDDPMSTQCKKLGEVSVSSRLRCAELLVWNTYTSSFSEQSGWREDGLSSAGEKCGREEEEGRHVEEKINNKRDGCPCHGSIGIAASRQDVDII